MYLYNITLVIVHCNGVQLDTKIKCTVKNINLLFFPHLNSLVNVCVKSI